MKTKIVAFYSPQGGSGKTTLAVNTSLYTTLTGRKTLLMDMAVYGSIISRLRVPQKGGHGLSTVITMLDLDVHKTTPDKLEDVLKSSTMQGVADCKLDVLLAANPVKMEGLSEEHVRWIIEAYKGLNYDLIALDMSSELSVKNLVLLEKCDLCVMPVIQDVSCGWKMILFKEVAARYMLEEKRLGLIVNKCRKNSGFNNIEFENETGIKVLAEIECFNRRYQNYINEGVQIYQLKNKRAVKSFERVSQTIVDYLDKLCEVKV